MNRKALYTAAGAFVVALIVGLLIGRTTASVDTEVSTTATTAPTATTVAPDEQDPTTVGDNPVTGSETSSVPEYGTEQDRAALVLAAEAVQITGSFSDQDTLLSVADRICFDIERLKAQNRSPSFATRVVWNESLATLSSVDLAGFATAFSLSTTHLCPDHREFGEAVAYILGI